MVWPWAKVIFLVLGKISFLFYITEHAVLFMILFYFSKVKKRNARCYSAGEESTEALNEHVGV